MKALLGKTGEILCCVQDRYRVDGETVNAPDGSTWRVPGTVDVQQMTPDDEREYNAAMGAHFDALDEAQEVAKAKRWAWMAEHGRRPAEAETDSIAASLPPATARPTVQLRSAEPAPTPKRTTKAGTSK